MSFGCMKTNQHIEDKNWELLAKSLYDENPEITTEEINSDVKGEFMSKEDIEQLLKITKKVDLYFDLRQYSAEEAWVKVESRIHNQISSNQPKIRKLFSNPIYRMVAAILVAAVILVSDITLFLALLHQLKCWKLQLSIKF